MAHAFEKAFVSFRIGITQWLPDACFEELMRLFEAHKGVTDEVTFFTSETHPPLPLETIQERVEVLAKRMPAVRKLGYRTGINILATIGHHNENLPNSLSADYTRMTDLDGRTCLGSFCPNDEGMQGYIKRLYQLVAGAGPDYIWVDDDVRLFGHMPIRCGCFCDRCLALFAEECGVRYTRASLRSALDAGPPKTKLQVRRAWLQHNRSTLDKLFRLIERTVHETKPGLPLGFMTGDRFFEGYDFDTWAKTLAGPDQAEVMWRPGGGTYTDHWLDGIAQKAHQIGRQTSLLPTRVRSIQSEIESFPYQRLKKSTHATALEACCYIASGCTGTAFNVLSMYDEPLDEYVPLVARLRQARPFLDLLARSFGRARPVGVHGGWVKDSFAARNADGGHWLDGGGCPGTHHADELLATGIPAAYTASDARVTAWAGDSVLALDEAEIKKALSSGVYMDAQALRRLHEMGYGALTGFTVERAIDHDCIEQLTAHPLNAGFAGRHRNGRQSFWHAQAFALAPADAKSKPLARIVDYSYQEVAPCCMGGFENRLGGRVCVAGYYPWTQLQNLSKSSQIKSVMRWLSKRTLPAYVASFHKANLWVRVPQKGRMAIAVVNAYLDPAKELTLSLLTDREEAHVFDMACGETTVRASKADGPYKAFTLPEVGAWEMRLVTI